MEVGEASMRLPERQREALALHELEGLPYEEIAAVMEVSPNTVAQLIARARINLRDELSGTPLASVAPSPQCERALPLIAMRDDAQLDAASSDAAWLDSHLAGCGRCRLAVEEMREAAASYRAWAPIAAASWQRDETIAKVGAAADAGRPAGPERGKPRRRATFAAGLLLLLTGLIVALAESNPSATPADPSAGAAPRPSARAPRRGAKAAGAGKARADAAKRKAGRRTAVGRTAVGATASVPVPTMVPTPVEGGAPSKPHRAHHTGTTGIRQAGQPRASKPKPASSPPPAAAPASSPAPAVEQPPAAEESAKNPHRHHEPPGKQPGHHLR